uniref:Uncharacterized protein n=1 Tax=Oryza barthii TaxID=65489 RepID=A0A0D3FWB4_9ORYZ
MAMLRAYLVDGVPGEAAEHVESKAAFDVADKNTNPGVGVAVGEEEVDGDVGEEDELDALEVEQLIGESAEEAELERGEEGGVDGPQEHHVRPDPVPSAVITSKPN